MSQLYVLKLEGGKYYVGKSDNPAQRYKQHKDGAGAAWTKKYTPVKFMETRALKGEHDETNLTKDLMKKYGVDNVRGGAYTQIVLDDATKAVLEREILGNTDKCYKCGLGGHFANQCPVEKAVPALLWECAYCPKRFATEPSCDRHMTSCPGQIGSNCYRCGRNRHYANNCFAKTHLDGSELEENEEDDEEEEGTCDRCGRTNHSSDNCYARTDVDGDEICD
jgi:predicted GIY-YIG superfamily endonuclease